MIDASRKIKAAAKVNYTLMDIKKIYMNIEQQTK
jgi:hypothetical protein